MSMRRHRWTREQAIVAARARWAAAHAGLSPRAPGAPLEGRLLRQVVVSDLLSGMRHTLDFYGTRFLNRWRVEVDGQLWKVCGWSAAMALVRKSCVRIGKER